jgi:hypothetical protein
MVSAIDSQIVQLREAWDGGGTVKAPSGPSK